MTDQTPESPATPVKGTPALPEFSLPTGRFFLSGAAAAVMPAAVGAVLAAMLRPGWLDACWLAGIAAMVGTAVGGLAVRPWKSRSLALWPAGLLLGQMASVGGVALIGLLLYSAARPEAVVVFGSVAAAGFLFAMFAQVAVFDRRQKASHPS